jgi:hypothetical protein
MSQQSQKLDAVSRTKKLSGTSAAWLSIRLSSMTRLISLVIACGVTNAMADTIPDASASGHNLPSAESVTLTTDPGPTTTATLKKCGSALLKVLLWEVYESSLYTPDGTWQEDTRPFRLDIRYLRTITAENLVKQTGKEWAEQGKVSPQHAAWQENLRSIWPNVADGDVISLAVDKADVSTFLFNGAVIGRLTDPQFGKDFSGIWLAADTTRPKLRRQLIGAAK